MVDNSRFAVGTLTISHTFEDISTSGFGSHIAISGCPSMLHLFVDTFFQFVVVENFAFAPTIARIRTLEAFGYMSQHELKISTVSK